MDAEFSLILLGNIIRIPSAKLLSGDLEEVAEGLSEILNEPVTPSMLYDYISIDKLIPYSH